MTAIFVLVGIVALVIAVIVLVAAPLRRGEAVARAFAWRRSVRIGTRVWVKRESKRNPSGVVRNVRVQNGGDAGRRRYTYEEQVWRNMGTVVASGRSTTDVLWPRYVLGKDEEGPGEE
jgi:hypothetical protein